MRSRRRVWVALSVGTVLAVTGGCIRRPTGEIPYCVSPAPGVDGGAAVGVTWHQDVKPIMKRRCFTCHRSGGPAPDFFQTFADLTQMGPAIARAVTQKQMPPWPPASCCKPLRHDRSLSDDEYSTIVTWLEQGMPEGMPADDLEPLPVTGLSRVDLEIRMPTSFTPSPPSGSQDQYRCFVADWPERRRRYVTGLDVAPGTVGMVHHAIVLWASAAQAPALHNEERLATDGPGFNCPGGLPDKPYAGSFGSWVPGGSAHDLDRGIGFRVEPGSVIIFAMHYTFFHGVTGADQTTARFKLDDRVDREAFWVTVADPQWYMNERNGMPIPAGQSDVSYAYGYDPTAIYRPFRNLRLHTVNLHMHRRGTHGILGIKRADGSTECMLQVDQWRDDWQDHYWLKDPVTVHPGDQVYVECHWNNTDEAQPLQATGERPPAKDLAWGPDQEMCAGYFLATKP